MKMAMEFDEIDSLEGLNGDATRMAVDNGDDINTMRATRLKGFSTTLPQLTFFETSKPRFSS